MSLDLAITLVMLLVMVCTPVGEPYFTDLQYRKIKPKYCTPEILATLNTSATESGSKYIISMILSTFGYLLADACADGVVVERQYRTKVDEVVERRQELAKCLVGLTAPAAIYRGKPTTGD